MSFFDDIIDTIFGGTDTSAQEAQQAANEAAARRIDASTAQARTDILDLFPKSDVARSQGFQGALDVLGPAILSQINATQQGSLGAQQNLLAGLPQFQNAILGGQIDFSALQPSIVEPQTGFVNQALPGFSVPQSAFAPRSAQQAVAQNSLSQALSGLLGGSGNFSGEGFSPTAAESFQASGTTPGADAVLSLFGLDQPGGPIGSTTSTLGNVGTLVGLLSGVGGLGTLAGALGGLSDAFTADERASLVTGGEFDSSGLQAALSGATSGLLGTSAQQQLDDFISTFMDDFSALQQSGGFNVGSADLDLSGLDAAIAASFDPSAPSVSTGDEFTAFSGDGDDVGGFDPGGGTTGSSGFDTFT